MSKAASRKTHTARNLVGGRVRLARQEAGLTQDQLCGQLARHGIVMDRSAVARIEAGVRYVQDYELLALSDALKVSLPWLFKRG